VCCPIGIGGPSITLVRNVFGCTRADAIDGLHRLPSDPAFPLGPVPAHTGGTDPMPLELTMMTANPEHLVARLAERPWPTALLLGRAALPWLLAAYIVYILLWYLPFKYYPDSYLFQVLEDSLGLPWFEPGFRYFTGGVEAVACLLLVVPGLQVAGAAVAFATMAGAIMLHLFTALGVDPYNDGGTLFKEACTNLVFAAIILFLRRDEILPLLRQLVTDPRAVRIVSER
jgi:hypothetical protein